MRKLKQNIIEFKAINFENTALNIAKRNVKFNELYYSNNELDNLKALNMLCDLMMTQKHIIDNEINNQGRY